MVQEDARIGLKQYFVGGYVLKMRNSAYFIIYILSTSEWKYYLLLNRNYMLKIENNNVYLDPVYSLYK
jgi:hypothetical protein